MGIHELRADVARLERTVALLACMLVETQGGDTPLREAIKLMRSGKHFGIRFDLDGDEIQFYLRLSPECEELS